MTHTTTLPNLTLRTYTSEDEPFIQQVYASSRELEMSWVDWSAEQKAAFLKMQCTAQLEHYHQHYVGAIHNLILLHQQPIGRIYIYHMPQEIRLMDITLLTPYRNQGFGSHLLQQLFAEADQQQKSVTLHVEIFNEPAQRLYRRFGFELTEDKGVYLFMTRYPQQAPNPVL